MLLQCCRQQMALINQGGVLFDRHEFNNSEPAHDHCDGHGHAFVKKTFHKPIWCHHCTDLLWGLMGQGYICEMCNFVSHERCLKHIISPCSSISSLLVNFPTSHCWAENQSSFFKKKFCNVCRRKCEDQPSLRCEVCEYYCHLYCIDYIVSDCKVMSANSSPDLKDAWFPRLHHWREGNLNTGSKCALCRKNCGNTESFSGMRCEWCQITAHPVCYRQISQECDFGHLKGIILQPKSVVLSQLSCNIEHIIDVDKTKSKRAAKNEEKDLKSLSTLTSPSSPTPADIVGYSDGDQQAQQTKQLLRVKIYDGNALLSKGAPQTVLVTKDAEVDEVLDAALKSFHICDDVRSYYLVDFDDVSRNSSIDSGIKPLLNLQLNKDKPSSFVLRYQDQDRRKGSIRVHSAISKVAVPFKNIKVNMHLTVNEVIHMALNKFGLSDEDTEKYHLIEMVMQSGKLHKRIMDTSESPLEVINQKRWNSIRDFKHTRFFLQEKSDFHHHVTVFIGNLPCNLSQRKYETTIEEIIGGHVTVQSYDTIYPQYGSVFAIFENGITACAAVDILRDAEVDDKDLIALILPSIHKESLSPDIVPLAVFVNLKSGGCQGLDLITQFRRLLNPLQVFDLDLGGPIPGLYVFRNLAKYRILVCGGDGTIGWVLSCLDDVGQESKCISPPIAVLPLGTGNDLARVLRWSGGWCEGDDLYKVLKAVDRSEEVQLDRWTIIFQQDERQMQIESDRKALSNPRSSSLTSEDIPNVLVMNNYFGIGIDADLSLGFHLKREENPEKFNSRFHNKGIYFRLGVKKFYKQNPCRDLHRIIILEVDQEKINIPPIEGLLIHNIASWGGGADLWGSDRDDKFKQPSQGDGKVEIVGLTGVVHMGQIKSGLRSAIRLGQGSHIRIKMKSDLPVQIDGEPWTQPRGQVVVTRSALPATMLKKRKCNINRRNTEPSVSYPGYDSPVSDSESSSEAPAGLTTAIYMGKD